MRIGLYCNWGIVHHNGTFYAPVVHKSYLDVISEKNGTVYLMCSVKECIPHISYANIDERKVNIITLPSFQSYIGSTPHFFSIVKGFNLLINKCDFIYIRTPEPFSWIASLLKNKTVTLNYHYSSNPIEVILNDDKKPYFIKLLKVLMFFPEFYLISFAAYFNNASANGPSVIQNIPFFIRNKTRVLYESTIPSLTLLKKKHRSILKDKKIKFLSVGRLQNGKGLHIMLDVFSLIKDKHPSVEFELTIIGSGPLSDVLSDYANSLELLDKVTFKGEIANGDELNSFYASHDVFILPSLSETGPRVLIEALSESNLCIASNVGYVSALLGERAGLIVDPGCVDDLSKSILWVYENRKQAQKMALSGFTVSKEYSIDNFFHQLFRG